MSQLKVTGRSGLRERLSISGFGVIRYGVRDTTSYWPLVLAMVGYADTLAMFGGVMYRRTSREEKIEHEVAVLVWRSGEDAISPS